MKKIFTHSLFAGIGMLAFSAAATADEFAEERWPRWYLGLSGGIGFLDDTKLKGATTGSIKYDEGWSTHAALGYRPHFGGNFLDGFRVEVEGGYFRNELDKGTVGGTPASFSKDHEVWTAMGNLYYDVNNPSNFTPYVGAGLGWAHASIGNEAVFNIADDGDNMLAYQFMAGLAYEPVTLPLTEWSLGYRLLMLDDPEFNSGGAKLALDDYRNHTVEVGARLRF